MKERVILHADCNSFYASVELLKYPELQNKPVAVAGSEDNRHGIILAKNECAKAYRVRTAETVWQARKKCPELILLPPHRAEYTYYSKWINAIYNQYTDLIEPFGIDESWLDITGSWHLFGTSPFEVANKIREEIKEKTKLTISVGISFNKIYAKLGSDLKKPDAVSEITLENHRETVFPLPVSALLYVGGKTQETLGRVGVRTIGQLAEADTGLLLELFGKMGPELKRYAAGEDDSEVARYQEGEQVKSVGNGLTFRRNLVGKKDIELGVVSLADEVAERLRKYGLYAKAVQIQIKDTNLKSISRQKVLARAANTSKDLFEAAVSLIYANWNIEHPVRMLTVTAIQLQEDKDAVQLSLWEEPAEQEDKREKLERSIDHIRERYGREALLQGGALHNDIGVPGLAKPKEQKKKEK